MQDLEPGPARLLSGADRGMTTQSIGSLDIPAGLPQGPIHFMGTSVPSNFLFLVAPGLTECLAHCRAFRN